MGEPEAVDVAPVAGGAVEAIGNTAAPRAADPTAPAKNAVGASRGSLRIVLRR